MFTKAQIEAATNQKRTGADFPALIKTFKALGILAYEHSVSDGTNVYRGGNGHSIVIAHPQPNLPINPESSAENLGQCLKIHQQGQTDYPTFCRQAAEAGVEKWVSDLGEMTVSYIDAAGKTLLVEAIPSGD